MNMALLVVLFSFFDHLFVLGPKKHVGAKFTFIHNVHNRILRTSQRTTALFLLYAWHAKCITEKDDRGYQKRGFDCLINK